MQVDYSKIGCLIFSKNRAAQLLAALESFSYMCEDFDKLDITVLYAVSTNTHEQQYKKLEAIYPNVKFKLESNLEYDAREIISGVDYILFVVDDCVFVNKFSMHNTVEHLIANSNAVGFSLRLGTNISSCYPFNCTQKTPRFVTVYDALRYDWTESEYDFGYPIDISSSVYRTADINTMLIAQHFSTVNNLEALLVSRCFSLLREKCMLLCFNTSKAFCNPLNVIVETNKNRKSDNPEYTVQTVAAKFEAGYKIDVSKLYGFVPIGCHQVVDPVWIAR